MMEHMFQSTNRGWVGRCMQTYNYPGPLLSISKWNMRELELAGRRNLSGRTVYIGNGIDLEDFPIEHGERRDLEPMVLVEGWSAYNPTKDVHRLAPKVAQRLKDRGYRIEAYGGHAPTDYVDVPHEFHVKPNLEELNTLYARATILLKASVCDARSCSPIEAMTKCTPTARAIVEGDDDLINDYNCLRVDYDEAELYQAARRLLDHADVRNTLSKNGLKHLETECNWTKWVDVIEETLKRGW